MKNSPQWEQLNGEDRLGVEYIFLCCNNKYLIRLVIYMRNMHQKERSKTVQITQKFTTLPLSPKTAKPILLSNSKITYQPPVNKFLLSQSNKLDKYVGNFSSRTSGKINYTSSTTSSKSKKTQVETMESIVKQNLKSLNYREKLNNIEALVKNSRQLCHQYGYFYITYAMLFYDPYGDTKLSVWIHPDTRMTKCLHPISKNTQYQKETEFVANLKAILRQFFPTIYLGNGRTFTSILIHLNQLKMQLFSKNKKIKTQTFYEPYPINNYDTERKYTIPCSSSNTELTKKYLRFQRTITEEVENEEEKEEKFVKKIQPKEQKKGLKKKIVKTPSFNDTLESIKLESLAKNCAEEISLVQTPKVNTTQIEEDLNNLFGSTDLSKGFYDKDKISQTNKKSMMQRMTDEFNDLF